MKCTSVKQTSVIPLAFAVVIGTFLRLYNIGFQCLWLEESYTLKMIREPVLDLVFKSVLYDFNPPGFYLVAVVSSWIFGITDMAIRYPSFIFGVALIIVMYYLGKEFCSETTGLYSAGIIAVLYPLVYYSQYGRAYSMLMLAFAIAFLYYIKIKNGDLSNRTTIAFAIASGACLWVHLFAGVPLLLMWLDVLVTTRNKLLLATAAIASPLALSFLSVIQHRGNAVATYGDSPRVLLFLTLPEFFGNLTAFILVPAGICLYLWDIKYKKELMAILFVTVAAGIAASVFTPVFPRYYLTVVLIPILLASVPLAKLSDRMIPEKVAMLAFMLLVAVFAFIQYPDFLVHYTVQKYVC